MISSRNGLNKSGLAWAFIVLVIYAAGLNLLRKYTILIKIDKKNANFLLIIMKFLFFML